MKSFIFFRVFLFGLSFWFLNIRVAEQKVKKNSLRRVAPSAAFLSLASLRTAWFRFLVNMKLRSFFRLFLFFSGLFLSGAYDLASQELNGISQYTLADTAKAYALLLESYTHMSKREFEEAVKDIEEAKKIYDNTIGPDHDNVVVLWDLAGKLYYHWDKYAKAVECFQKAASIFEKIHGDDLLPGVPVYNNLGVALNANGDYNNAVIVQKKTLEIQLRQSGEMNVNVASHHNHIGVSYQYLGKYDSALVHHKKALEIGLILAGENSRLVADTYNNIGTSYGHISMREKGIEFLEKALSVFKLIAGENDGGLINVYNNLGLAYSEIGKFELAEEYLNTALRIRIKYLGDKHTAVATSFNNLATNYSNKKDFKNAIDYINKAMEALPGEWGNESIYHGQFLNNLGVHYSNIKDVDKAINCHEKALKIRLKSGNDHQGIAGSFHNLGAAYLGAEDYEKAETYLSNALELRLKNDTRPHPDNATLYNLISNVYEGKKDYARAIEWSNEALKICEALGKDAELNLAETLLILASYNFKMNQLEQAAWNAEQALEIRLDILKEKHPYIAANYDLLGTIYSRNGQFSKAQAAYEESLENLNYFGTEDFDKVNAPWQLTHSLNNYGLLLKELYRHDGNAGNLHQARKLFHQAIKSIKYQSNTLSPSIKSFLNKDAKMVYDGFVNVNLLLHTLTDSLHYLTESFSFAERSKAMLLYEAMQETNALSVSGIPDSLLQQEYDFRIDIAYYDKKRQEKISAGASDTDSTVLAIGSKLFDLNRRYEALKSRFETGYPQYYKAKYDLSTITLEEVQNELLQPSQSLLEYLVGDSNIYVFLVRKDTFVVREIKHDFPLDTLVRDMTKDGIYGYSRQSNDRKKETISNYTRSAYQLYEKLVAPVADWLTEEVIVIPDGVLGYVPFEALLTTQPPKEAVGRFSYYDFMLKKHQVSYCYSATLLQEMRQKQHRQQPEEKLLALAPFYRGNVPELFSRIDTTDLLSLRDSLGALDASGEEVAVVSKLLKGKSFYGGQASLDNFKQEAGRYRILHLSTHGKADDRAGDYAYLAFGVSNDSSAFDKLYARDLYNYSLNADMVVLSACETGIGKLRRGEGIVSLARAFAYAGAKSIFTTLWRVSDAKTAELMRLFYKKLRKGMNKDAALWQAKLDFLKNNKGEASHPFFWAGMIGIGDMGAVK